MSDKKTFQKWGYSKDDAKIFDIEEGGKLPSGYYESPADIPKNKPKSKAKAK